MVKMMFGLEVSDEPDRDEQALPKTRTPRKIKRWKQGEFIQPKRMAWIFVAWPAGSGRER